MLFMVWKWALPLVHCIIIVVHVFQGREDQYLLQRVMWTVIMWHSQVQVKKTLRTTL